MSSLKQILTRSGIALLASAGLMAGVSLASSQPGASPDQQKLSDILARTSQRTAAFLEQFSDVKCTEQVRQEKLGKDDKVELKEDSTFDYLVMLTNNGGDLSLSESRIAMKEAKRDRRNTSMLLSNGFATLFLVFHPSYSSGFKFTLAGEDELGGRILQKVTFEHIPGMRSPAALALRGREYPLELSGTAWIDPESGSIAKIEAGISDTLADVGLKSLDSEIDFTPVPFNDAKQVYWFPTQARVDVETPKQHWRNLHQFSSYKKFSVSTEEQVVQK
jgi:hypothetical protein